MNIFFHLKNWQSNQIIFFPKERNFKGGKEKTILNTFTIFHESTSTFGY